jgi:hypothetical protein
MVQKYQDQGTIKYVKQRSIYPKPSMGEDDDLFFKISLAQWSLNRKLRGKEKELDNLDFPAYAKDNFGIHAVEYVDKFFPSADKEYIKGLLKRTEDIGVKNVLLMIDTADYGISVIVENHGGLSSRASWLTSVIRNIGMINCGVLPDFGNFVIDSKPGREKYDLYQGMKELMPLARGVSAKDLLIKAGKSLM